MPKPRVPREQPAESDVETLIAARVQAFTADLTALVRRRALERARAALEREDTFSIGSAVERATGRGASARAGNARQEAPVASPAPTPAAAPAPVAVPRPPLPGAGTPAEVVQRAGVTHPQGPLDDMLDAVELYLLQEALRAAGNNKTRAARALGITREGLHKKLRNLGAFPPKAPAGD